MRCMGVAPGPLRVPGSAMRGKQMDLSALKQEIQDDAGLLSNWRKAFPGCRWGRLVQSWDFRGFQKGDVEYPKEGWIWRLDRSLIVADVGWCWLMLVDVGVDGGTSFASSWGGINNPSLICKPCCAAWIRRVNSAKFMLKVDTNT